MGGICPEHQGRAPDSVTSVEEVSVRAWPGPPGPNTLAGVCLRSKCDNFRTVYGLRPSSLRVGVSMLCMTASPGVTSWGRRGNGSELIVALRGSMV